MAITRIEDFSASDKVAFQDAIGVVTAIGVETAARAAADVVLQNSINGLVITGGGISNYYLETDSYTAQPDVNFRTPIRWDYRCSSRGLNPGYPSIAGASLSVNCAMGQNWTDTGHYYKTTFLNATISMRSPACGQRVSQSWIGDFQGCGDAIMVDCTMIIGGGVSAYGDEAQEWSRFVMSSQGTHLRSTVSSSIKYVANTTLVANTNPSTVTNSTTGARQVQTIALASTTGLTVGDWLCFGIGAPQSDAWMRCEAVQVLSISGNNITAIIDQFHPAGEVIRGCTKITTAGGANVGQQRFLVNQSTTLATGTAQGIINTNRITGTGTNWSTAMIGGTINNIGMIAFTVDDRTPSFYSAAFPVGDPAKAWYPIKQINSATELVVHRQQQANWSAYEGDAVATSSAYKLCPAARILRPADPIDQYYSELLLDYNEFSWPSGAVLDCPISTSLDISGGTYRMYHYTPGVKYRDFFGCINMGTENFDAAFSARGGGNGGSFLLGADLLGVTAGLKVGAELDSGGDAILIAAYSPIAGTPSEGTIRWGNSGGYVKWDWANMGMKFVAAARSYLATLTFISSTSYAVYDSVMDWWGQIRVRSAWEPPRILFGKTSTIDIGIELDVATEKLWKVRTTYTFDGAGQIVTKTTVRLSEIGT